MVEAATGRHLSVAGVSPEIIRIGADIVELLTSGMYLSPVTVFREYVQNSADGIDAARADGLIGATEQGKVEITFNHAERAVTIRDNGAGIPSAKAASVLLAIGGSGKRGTTARGFRGVGRLSGLAYCRELEFRTKSVGEAVETIVVWNSLALRSGIAAARSETDLRQVVASAVQVRSQEVAERESHYFEVVLRHPMRHRQDALLNERQVAHYLSQVAPVPFSPDFTWAAEIEERIGRHDPARVPIALVVAGETINRPYRSEVALPGTDKTISINEIEFFELLNVDGDVGALGWLGHHEYIRSIPTGLGIRGLRARVGNVQIGESGIFDELFKEPRFNGWTIGEINVLDPRILPNGRRDNFEVNHHSNQLLVQLGPIAGQISTRCRTSSVDRNATLIVKNTIGEIDRLLAHEHLEAIQISRALGAVHRCVLKLRAIAEIEARAPLAHELVRLETELAARRPSDRARVIASDEAIALVGRIVTDRAQAKRLTEELRRLEG